MATVVNLPRDERFTEMGNALADSIDRVMNAKMQRERNQKLKDALSLASTAKTWEDAMSAFIANADQSIFQDPELLQAAVSSIQTQKLGVMPITPERLAILQNQMDLLTKDIEGRAALQDNAQEHEKRLTEIKIGADADALQKQLGTQITLEQMSGETSRDVAKIGEAGAADRAKLAAETDVRTTNMNNIAAEDRTRMQVIADRENLLLGGAQRLGEIAAMGNEERATERVRSEEKLKQLEASPELSDLEKIHLQNASEKDIAEFEAEVKSAVDENQKTRELGQTAIDVKDNVTLIRPLIQQVNSGPLAPAAAAIESIGEQFGVDLKGKLTDNLAASQALAGLAFELAAPMFQAVRPVSDTEFQQIIKMVPNLQNSVEGNLLIVELIEAQANKDAQIAEFERELQDQGLKAIDRRREVAKKRAELRVLTPEVQQRIEAVIGTGKPTPPTQIGKPAALKKGKNRLPSGIEVIMSDD